MCTTTRSISVWHSVQCCLGAFHATKTAGACSSKNYVPVDLRTIALFDAALRSIGSKARTSDLEVRVEATQGRATMDFCQ